MAKPANKPGAKSTRRAAGRSKQSRPGGRWIVFGLGAALLAILIYFTWAEAGAGGGLDPDQVPDPALGPAAAPVVITEYSDFGCPACRSWHNAGIRAQILAEFGDQVRFVWKDFPVITAYSPRAAEAGQCAAAQGEFWAYHDQVYEHFAGLNDAAMRSYATQVGLDMAAFDTCVEDRQMRRKVQANDQEARRLGMRGTPGFTINGKPLPAPPSYDQLARLVQQELSAP